jgi:hypothetical protein
MLFKPLGTSRLSAQGATCGRGGVALVVEQCRAREQELDESMLEEPEKPVATTTTRTAISTRTRSAAGEGDRGGRGSNGVRIFSSGVCRVSYTREAASSTSRAPGIISPYEGSKPRRVTAARETSRLSSSSAPE